ncbi:hypothetical protein DMB38_18060 [Streptomyces sp. WAC 06738]|uniref:DUF3105 domain-containing protein n=1 Tax=Streptomyces sp. WAC 06738 TaxID=2203210 RepID=UPI000F6B57BC|nr:DUF3105 domain-containing protein [Streptomyces sp. WAC 06738]AZM47442.1 hypothetical protein DMB38_18060 [Streptomyces sp. WAC 06738]
MGSAKSKAAARRARVEEMRRKEAARERRSKQITYLASAVVVVATAVGGYFIVDSAREDEKAAAAPLKGEQSWDDLDQNHVTEDVDYKMTPPAGGDHDPAWQNCNGDVYDQPIRDENAVHSLEHGAVWVTYGDKAKEADVKTLSERVTNTPYSLMSPHPDQTGAITLSAWGKQLTVEKAADPKVGKFFDKYVQGPQTPEQGAACTGGKDA